MHIYFIIHNINSGKIAVISEIIQPFLSTTLLIALNNRRAEIYFQSPYESIMGNYINAILFFKYNEFNTKFAIILNKRKTTSNIPIS